MDEPTAANEPVATRTDAPAIRIAGLTKRFGNFAAVDDVDLEIADGEFFTMLGPSGSGKTTTLRLIAGFEAPDEGSIKLFGRDVATLPPFEREVNTVFQDYALFPHMSVADNVAYALKVAGVAKAERRAAAADALETVRLSGMGERRPAQLSGGQRQRVALARAIVARPKVLLLDEPLGALDLKLREEMQHELSRLQRELGITFVYVTHDQDEALGLSDRLAVFNAGRIEQVATPLEVYERPESEFVADFVGTCNLLERDGRRFTIRPERIAIIGGAQPDGMTTASGTVLERRYSGHSTRCTVELDDGEEISVLVSSTDNTKGPSAAVGERILIGWRREHEFELPISGQPKSEEE